MIRKIYTKKIIMATSPRGQNKIYNQIYWTMAVYYGWKWKFISKKRKNKIVMGMIERI